MTGLQKSFYLVKSKFAIFSSIFFFFFFFLHFKTIFKMVYHIFNHCHLVLYTNFPQSFAQDSNLCFVLFSLLLLNISATGLVVFCGQSNISIKPLPLIQENCVLKIVGLWKQSLKYHVLYKLTCQKMAILKLLYIISEKSNSITNNY